MVDAEESEKKLISGTYHMRPRPILNYHLEEFHQANKTQF